MVVPARPTSGAPIETAWGNIVHDAAVALDVQSGSIPCAMSAVVLRTDLAVTFPRPFASAPYVIASVGGFSTSSVNLNAGVVGVTPSGCTLGVREVREIAVSATGVVNWVAVGPRA